MSIKNLFEISILLVNIIGFLGIFYKITSLFVTMKLMIDNIEKRVEKIENEFARRNYQKIS